MGGGVERGRRGGDGWREMEVEWEDERRWVEGEGVEEHVSSTVI